MGTASSWDALHYHMSTKTIGDGEGALLVQVIDDGTSLPDATSPDGTSPEDVVVSEDAADMLPHFSFALRVSPPCVAS